MRRAFAIALVLTGCALPFPDVDDGKSCQRTEECPPDQRCHPALSICFSAVPECATDDALLPDGTRCALESQDGICLSGACVESRCGDGFVDAALAGETCDDANDDDGDDCTNACTVARCGDGVVRDGVERCDDGNTVDGDGCRGDCNKVETCGDGIVDASEVCDDANDNPSDGCDRCARPVWRAAVLTGFGPGNGVGPATAVERPTHVVTDLGGNIYVSSQDARVRRIDVNGDIAIVAGNGSLAGDGNGGPATNASIGNLGGLAVDVQGNLYVTDLSSDQVRVVGDDGVIRALAGDGTFAIGVDLEGLVALEAGIRPGGVAVAPNGRVFFVHQTRIFLIDDDGRLRTFAGGGEGPATPDDQPALGASLEFADGFQPLAFRGDGALCFGTLSAVRCVELDGTLSTLSTEASNVSSFTFDADDALLVVDVHQVVRVSDAGREVLLGLPELNPGLPACDEPFEGEGGAPDQARLACPLGVAVGLAGELYVADTGHDRVRVLRDGVVDTVLGSGLRDDDTRDVAATSFDLPFNGKVTLDPEGRPVLATGAGLRVVRLDDDGGLTTLAGNGAFGTAQTGELAAEARVGFVTAVTFDSSGRLVFTDSGADSRVLRVNLDGTLEVLAAGPPIGLLDGVDAAPDGGLFVADQTAHIVFHLAPDGTLSPFAGNGSPGSAGDGGLAIDAQLNRPTDVLVDGDRVYIADSTNNVVRVVEGGLISVVAGQLGISGDTGDGESATAATLGSPTGLGLADGRLFITDPVAGRVRFVEDGLIHAFAGSGENLRDTGDGGAATNAQLQRPNGVAVDGEGRAYISTQTRLRRVEDEIRTVIGAVDPFVGQIEGTLLTDPVSVLAVDDAQMLLATPADNRVIRVRPDLGRSDVVVGYPEGYGFGEDPAGENRARFARLLEGASGLAFDGVQTVFVSERQGGRVMTLNLVDLDDASTWTLAPLVEGLSGPSALAFDPFAPGGALLVADTDAHVVREVDLTSLETSVRLGVDGVAGVFDGFLVSPSGVAVGDDGAIFVADTGNHRVLRVIDDVVDVVIGTGEASSSGDGTPARDLPVQAPAELAIDPFGNLLVASTRALRLVAADADGAVSPDAEVLTLYGSPPRAAFPESATFCVSGVSARDDERIVLTDRCAGYLIELTRGVP